MHEVNLTSKKILSHELNNIYGHDITQCMESALQNFLDQRIQPEHHNDGAFPHQNVIKAL